MNDRSRPTVAPKSLRIRALWALVHPGPSLASAAAYVVFALLATGGRPTLVTLTVTTIGMIALQFAISAFNDYSDREADAHSHKFKPVALGILSPRVAVFATVALSVITLACYAPFGLTPTLMAMTYLAVGFAYDLGLKSTLAGALLVGLAFPLLPMLAWTLFASFKPALFWTFPIGLAVGASIHIADALPDLAADTAAGARTLAQTLGRSAIAVEWGALIAAAALPALLAALRWTPSRPAILAGSLTLALALVAASMLIARAPWPAARRLRLNFVLTSLTALIIGAGWIASAIV
ncbi:MAG TPA: UbiA family prenyltransferase [Ktedonobacterales bacterium]